MDTTLVLAQDALTSFDVSHILAAAPASEVRYHVLVPADTERNLLVGLLDDIYTDGFREAFAAARRGMPDSRTATITAQQSLDASIVELSAAGATATGEIVADDPLPALRAAVAADPSVASVVVVTDPHAVEDTFRRDWASKARDALDLPVLHLYRGTSMLG